MAMAAECRRGGIGTRATLGLSTQGVYFYIYHLIFFIQDRQMTPLYLIYAKESSAVLIESAP